MPLFIIFAARPIPIAVPTNTASIANSYPIACQLLSTSVEVATIITAVTDNIATATARYIKVLPPFCTHLVATLNNMNAVTNTPRYAETINRLCHSSSINFPASTSATTDNESIITTLAIYTNDLSASISFKKWIIKLTPKNMVVITTKYALTIKNAGHDSAIKTPVSTSAITEVESNNTVSANSRIALALFFNSSIKVFPKSVVNIQTNPRSAKRASEPPANTMPKPDTKLNNNTFFAISARELVIVTTACRASVLRCFAFFCIYAHKSTILSTIFVNSFIRSFNCINLKGLLSFNLLSAPIISEMRPITIFTESSVFATAFNERELSFAFTTTDCISLIELSSASSNSAMFVDERLFNIYI